MSSVQNLSVVFVDCLLALIIGNLGFQIIAELRNPYAVLFIPTVYDFTYIDRGDPEAPCVVLFHGNGSLIQDFIVGGTVDLPC